MLPAQDPSRGFSTRPWAVGVWFACFAITVALPAMAAGADPQPPQQNPDHIVLVESARVVAVYSNTISSQGPHRRAWFRIEYPVPPAAPRGSERHWRQLLGEFDCAGRRWRVSAQLKSDPPPEVESPAPTVWQPIGNVPAPKAVYDYVCHYAGPSVSPGETIYLM